MAKRKRPRKPPQARHRKKSKASRHDKRNRLRRANSQRVPTREASVPLTGAMAVTVASMATGRSRSTTRRRNDSGRTWRPPMSITIPHRDQLTVPGFMATAGPRSDTNVVA